MDKETYDIQNKVTTDELHGAITHRKLYVVSVFIVTLLSVFFVVYVMLMSFAFAIVPLIWIWRLLKWTTGMN